MDVWCAPGGCFNNCNYLGRCRPFDEVASSHASGTTDPGVAVTAHGVTYTNWEANKWFMCVCDFGVYGPDCSDCT